MVVRVLMKDAGNKERLEKLAGRVIGHGHAETAAESCRATPKSGSRLAGRIRDFGVQRRGPDGERIGEIDDRQMKFPRRRQGEMLLRSLDPVQILRGKLSLELLLDLGNSVTTGAGR